MSKPDGWLFWGILGVIAAPFVVGACATLVQAVGYEVRQLAECLGALPLHKWLPCTSQVHFAAVSLGTQLLV